MATRPMRRRLSGLALAASLTLMLPGGGLLAWVGEVFARVWEETGMMIRLEHDVVLQRILPHLIATCPGCRERYEEIRQLQREAGHEDEEVSVVEWREAPERRQAAGPRPFPLGGGGYRRGPAKQRSGSLAR